MCSIGTTKVSRKELNFTSFEIQMLFFFINYFRILFDFCGIKTDYLVPLKKTSRILKKTVLLKCVFEDIEH